MLGSLVGCWEITRMRGRQSESEPYGGNGKQRLNSGQKRKIVIRTRTMARRSGWKRSPWKKLRLRLNASYENASFTACLRYMPKLSATSILITAYLVYRLRLH